MSTPNFDHSGKEPNHIGFVQLANLVLSVYVLLWFMVESEIRLGPEIHKLLDLIDYIVCLFFFYDFLTRFIHAKSKWRYMRWGWFDLISCIPAGPFAMARLFRIVVILRVLRAFRSTRYLIDYLYHRRSQGVLMTVVLMCFLLITFASAAELYFEITPDSNIKTTEDALWWSISTITTVACEKYPVTTGGRIVAVFLMISGVCLFGTITAFISSLFLEKDIKKEDSDIAELTKEIRLLREKVEKLGEGKAESRES